MTTLLQLTYSGLFLAVLAQQLGLPIPSVVFLMAAGALSAHGKMNPSDHCTFGYFGLPGRRMGYGSGSAASGVLRLCGYSAGSLPTREAAPGMRKKRFAVMVSPVLCVAKFLPGLDAVIPPLCGAEGVSLTLFLALDTVGSFLWSSFYVGLGYLFSNELDVAIRWVQHFGTALGFGIGIPIALYAGWRGLVLVRMIRQLRLRRISPPMLARKLKSNSKVACSTC